MKWIHAFLSMLFICASFAYGGSLQGIVRDAQSLIPIDGVNVTVHVVIPDSIPFPTTTDQNGAYSIAGIIPNNKIYAVVTHKNGYIMSYSRIDNLGSLDLVYDIYITPELTIPPGGGDSSTVFGAVLTPSAHNGSLIPIANAQVRLTSEYQHFDAITNSEGKYTTNIPLGSYSVSVSADGYSDLTVTVVQLQPIGATVNAVLQSTTVGIASDQEQSQPDRFALLNAYPNPFNPSTRIAYKLKEAGFVTLRVYDLTGREVATLVNGVEGPGFKSVNFDARDLASGVFFYRLQAGSFAETKKMILIR
ncbi:hypothetical protein A2V82_10880 [candidate division KSB1 bacterium RBG_16_48_16]|nr:MAG: hypothetical protein A2V82_10880 [candidate division KSB1 bacterium RBG_16_48_16]